MGVLAPVFWTFKVYWTRKTILEKSYDLKDLAIDTVVFKTFFQTIIYVVYLCNNDFELVAFIQGQVAGSLF